MAESRGSPSTDFYNILGISKTASNLDVSRAYKSLVRKWHPDKNPSNTREAEAKFTAINEAYKVIHNKKQQERVNEPSTSDCPSNPNRRSNYDDSFFSSGRGNHGSMATDRGSNFSRGSSSRESTPTKNDLPNSLTKTMSRWTPFATSSGMEIPAPPRIGRRSTTPIVFSQSAMLKKAHAIEKNLTCSLEELCNGCTKKVKITRHVITSTGAYSEEDEILKIQVKPGWRKGTKITFEGKGDVRPGSLPADIIVAIEEKRHPLFKRRGDDLELGVEIPLVQALTGCRISVPLLGGETMRVSFDDDIILPDSEKVIKGEGMPLPKERGARGDLRLKFRVNFPRELSEEQRSEVRDILQHAS